ncbi:MAG: Lsr2 family protein [Nocardioides sp.]
MAKRTHIILTDDISGETIKDGKGGTVTFGLEGVDYAIDLTDKNAEKLRAALADYIAAGTRIGRKTGTRGSRTQSGPSAREVRDWARSHGFTVPDRGRIPTEVRQAFDGR